MYLQVKKKKKRPVLIQVKPTIAILNRSKLAMEEMKKKKKKKKKKMRTTTVFTTTEQYNCFRWPEKEEFLTWRGGWISLRLSAKPCRGAEVWWWWWRQWLDSMDRNMVLVLLCFSETFWRLLECQKAYVCVREKAGVQIWRLGHKENEKNKSCREKECVMSEAICVCGKDQWKLLVSLRSWEVRVSGITIVKFDRFFWMV